MIERARDGLLEEIEETRWELLRELEPLSGVTSEDIREMGDKLDRLPSYISLRNLPEACARDNW